MERVERFVTSQRVRDLTLGTKVAVPSQDTGDRLLVLKAYKYSHVSTMTAKHKRDNVLEAFSFVEVDLCGCYR